MTATITLLAYAADERWAFVREGDELLLVRPSSADAAATPGDVERAVTQGGYTASGASFDSRTALATFLSDESVRAWRTNHPLISLADLRVQLRGLAGREEP